MKTIRKETQRLCDLTKYTVTEYAASSVAKHNDAWVDLFHGKCQAASHRVFRAPTTF